MTRNCHVRLSLHPTTSGPSSKLSPVTDVHVHKAKQQPPYYLQQAAFFSCRVGLLSQLLVALAQMQSPILPNVHNNHSVLPNPELNNLLPNKNRESEEKASGRAPAALAPSPIHRFSSNPVCATRWRCIPQHAGPNIETYRMQPVMSACYVRLSAGRRVGEQAGRRVDR